MDDGKWSTRRATCIAGSSSMHLFPYIHILSATFSPFRTILVMRMLLYSSNNERNSRRNNSTIDRHGRTLVKLDEWWEEDALCRLHVALVLRSKEKEVTVWPEIRIFCARFEWNELTACDNILHRRYSSCLLNSWTWTYFLFIVFGNGG